MRPDDVTPAAHAAPSPRRDLRRVVINALTGGLVDQLDRMEEQMAVTQADLDNLAAQLVEDHGEIQQELSRLATDHPELDLTGLRTAVANIGQLVPSQTGGGEGPIAEDPSTPIVGDPDAPAASDPATDTTSDGESTTED